MHCCGTSLTARLLNILGYDLGTDGQHSDSTSPSRTGARRQSPLSEINDAIFDTLGGTWWRPPEMAADWERRREIQALRQDALQAIQSEFGDSTRWAWRDPRTSLTLAFWRDLVPHARWVICMRSPIEAASSLLSGERGELSWDAAVQLWLRHLASAVEAIKTTRRDADRDTERKDRALVKTTRARNTRRALERSRTWRLSRPLRTLYELLLGLHRQASAARSWHRLRARGPLDRRRAK